MIDCNMGATMEEMMGMVESFANAVKDGSIDIKEIIVTEGSHLSHTMLEFGGDDHRVEMTKILQIEFVPVRPKKMKSQFDIYQELFAERKAYLINMMKSSNTFITEKDLEDVRIKANIYACKNTVKVWREQ